jgi:hypothetical protein
VRALLTQNVAADFVRPGDTVITADGGQLEVDEVRIGAEVIEYYGWPDGRRSRQRSVVRAKHDERVDIQPAPPVVADVLTAAFPEAHVFGLTLLVPLGGDGGYTLVLGLPQPMAGARQLSRSSASGDDDVIDAEVVEDDEEGREVPGLREFMRDTPPLTQLDDEVPVGEGGQWAHRGG